MTITGNYATDTSRLVVAASALAPSATCFNCAAGYRTDLLADDEGLLLWILLAIICPTHAALLDTLEQKLVASKDMALNYHYNCWGRFHYESRPLFPPFDAMQRVQIKPTS